MSKFAIATNPDGIVTCGHGPHKCPPEDPGTKWFCSQCSLESEMLVACFRFVQTLLLSCELAISVAASSVALHTRIALGPSIGTPGASSDGT